MGDGSDDHTFISPYDFLPFLTSFGGAPFFYGCLDVRDTQVGLVALPLM